MKKHTLNLLYNLTLTAFAFTASAQDLTTRPSLTMTQQGTNMVLSWTGTEYYLQQAATLPPSLGASARRAPVTVPMNGSMGFFRLCKQIAEPRTNVTQTPWAVLLCNFQDDQSAPPVPDFMSVCQKFFTSAGAGTYNAVQFFHDMSHAAVDLGGSQVFGWLTLDAKVSDLLPDKAGKGAGETAALPGSKARRNKMMTLAKRAAWKAGIPLEKFYGVVLVFNVAVGEPQGGAWAGGVPVRGVFSDWRYVSASGPESFGQQMDRAYGLDRSRRDGSVVDGDDRWDTMSTANAFWAGDETYGARGPGFNAWNLRGRRWLDESRVWQATNRAFSQTIELRPLYRRDLPGVLAAELPPFDGPKGRARYLVEFRVKEGWDFGIPRSAVLVHRFKGAINQFLGSHSYLMSATNGEEDLIAGDEFSATAANGSVSRVEVVALDEDQRTATVRLSYTPMRGHADKRPAAFAQYSNANSSDKPLQPAPIVPMAPVPLPAPQPKLATPTTPISMVTNGPAVYTTSDPSPTAPKLVFDHFLPNSLNNFVWTNVMAHTNGRTTQIWSERTRPANWPAQPPKMRWATNGLMWGMKGLTGLSPSWEAEYSPGQMPITALTKRHGYTRGHGMGPDGFTTNFNGKKVWFLTADNKIVETTVASAVVRVGSGPTGQDYTIVMFKDDLPDSIRPLRVVSVKDRAVRFCYCQSAPWPLFQTEQAGQVNANLPGLTLNAYVSGDSGSPDLLPLGGELIFSGGRSTAGPSRQMQADMDQLSNRAGLDPKDYQLQWADVSVFPSF